jgi:hypothetical protein
MKAHFQKKNLLTINTFHMTLSIVSHKITQQTPHRSNPYLCKRRALLCHACVLRAVLQRGDKKNLIFSPGYVSKVQLHETGNWLPSYTKRLYKDET